LATSILLHVTSCAIESERRNSGAGDRQICSIVALLSVPDEFDGRRVRTFGYLSSGEEFRALFLTRADAELGIFANSIEIDTGNSAVPRELWERWNESYVMIEGRFDADSAMHFGPTTGTIEAVSALSPVRQ